MLTSTSITAALLIASPVLAYSHKSPRSHQHQLGFRQAKRLARRSAQPSTLASGSLTASEGCTQWTHVEAGQDCAGVAQAASISLDQFYSMNPEIDSDCQNLWAGYDYCVAQTTTSSGSGTAATKTAKKVAAVAQAKVTASPAASSSTSSDDGEDGECDDDEDDDSASSSSATTSSKAAEKTANASSGSSLQSTVSKLVASTGITGFLGTPNTGAIASWFHTDLSSDSTNGHSWCGFPYNDQVPGFAPSVGTMLNNFGGDYEKAATAYCGLEAEFTTPDGRTATLYIADGFDDHWVRTPNSVDVVYGSFAKLFGRQTDNKNDVVQNVSWRLTGNRNPQYVFKGPGSG